MKSLVLSTLFALGAITGNTSAADAPFTLAVVPARSSADGMAIEIGTENARPFYTVLTNQSKQGQPVFETWNSWGFYNVEFEATMPDGKKLQIQRGIQIWTKNFPSTFLIPPGERYIRAFSDRNPSWQIKPAWPKEGQYEVTLKAVYKVEDGREPKEWKVPKVWFGRVESPEYKMKVIFGPEPKSTAAKPPEPKQAKPRKEKAKG